MRTYRSATQKALDAGDFVITDIPRLRNKRVGFVLAHRTGVTTDTMWSLCEIGRALGVTTERIRQLEAKGLMQILDVKRAA